MLKTLMIFMVSFAVLITACKTTGHRYVNINPPSFGAQFIPQQINTLLENNGFHKIKFTRDVTDQNARPEEISDLKRGKVIDEENSLLMQYQHESYKNININVTIGKYKGDAKLEFFETNRQELSEQGIKLFEQVIKALKESIYDENDLQIS